MGGFDAGVGAFGVGTSWGGDADEPHPLSSIAPVIRTMTRLSLVAAFKVLRLLWISLSLVVRMLGIRTQRTAPSGNARPVAVAAGDVPFSTQFTSDVSRLKLSSAASPPLQCPIPGARYKRLQLLTTVGPPLALVMRS